MKPVWKGTLTFGLVSLDVVLYSAIKEHAIGFTLLHQTCKHPLKYKRWCPHCQKEVLWDETTKGLKVSKNNYIILNKEVLEKFKPEKTTLLTLHYFIPTDQIPVLYFDNHYYVIPQNEQNPAFGVLM